MKLLILNASPKKKGGASRFFSSLFRLFLPGIQSQVHPLRNRQDFGPARSLLPSVDAVCLVFPLYVDALPSHVVEFLSLAETDCRARPHALHFYALANNGFVEGRQNACALHILEAWCQRSGAVWGGGVGIGGGTMLRVLGIVYPILITVVLLQMVLSLFSTGTIPSDLVGSLAVQIGTWLFLNCGVLLYLFQLSLAVRKQKTMRNRFTRVMIPSVLFVPVADLFMLLSSLFHGRFLFALLRQDHWPDH